MASTRLSRKHGFKLNPGFSCSVEECVMAVAKVVGAADIVSAGRMNGAVVMFVKEIEQANAIIASGALIRDTLVEVQPLSTPAKRVLVGNVPPLVEDSTLVELLSRYGKVVSPVRKLSSGCKQPEFRHIISHRRQLMIQMNNSRQELNLSFKVTVDGFDSVLFATTDNMRCFGCGMEGHQRRFCPEEGVSGTTGGAGEGGTGGEGEAGMGGRGGSDGGGGVWGSVGKKKPDSRRIEGGGEAGAGGAEGKRVKGGGEEGGGGVGGGEEGGGGAEAELLHPQENLADGADCLDSQEVRGHAGGQVETEKTGKRRTRVEEEEEEEEEEEVVQISGRVLRDKRKKEEEQGPKAKKVNSNTEKATRAEDPKTDSSSEEEDRSEDSIGESYGELSDDSTKERTSDLYGVEGMKKFLQKTKNVRGVRIQDHFPDRGRFLNRLKENIKIKGEAGLTEREIFRLKKFKVKVRRELLNEDWDVGVSP